MMREATEAAGKQNMKIHPSKNAQIAAMNVHLLTGLTTRIANFFLFKDVSLALPAAFGNSQHTNTL